MNSLLSYINEELILERYVNVLTKSEMKQYAAQVWAILQKAYTYCGGIKSISNKEELVEKTQMWKLIRKHGDIIAVNCYKTDKGGRKICLGGSNNTEEGVQSFKKMLEEEFRLKDRNSWIICSGKAAVTSLRNNGMPIPSKIACEILKNPDKYKPFNEYWIDYNLNGEIHHKLMVGNYPGIEHCNPPKELIDKLIQQAKEFGA